jgi:hypothetical protein
MGAVVLHVYGKRHKKCIVPLSKIGKNITVASKLSFGSFLKKDI